jgi:hypothetical protein
MSEISGKRCVLIRHVLAMILTNTPHFEDTVFFPVYRKIASDKLWKLTNEHMCICICKILFKTIFSLTSLHLILICNCTSDFQFTVLKIGYTIPYFIYKCFDLYSLDWESVLFV